MNQLALVHSYSCFHIIKIVAISNYNQNILLDVIDNTHTHTYCGAGVAHGPDEGCRLRGDGPYRLRPSLTVQTGHGGFVRQTELVTCILGWEQGEGRSGGGKEWRSGGGKEWRREGVEEGRSGGGKGGGGKEWRRERVEEWRSGGGKEWRREGVEEWNEIIEESVISCILSVIL